MKYDTTIHPGDVLACGDIHGRFDLLRLFLAHVKDTGARVILLGDLIDRGPDDVGVLEAVRNLLEAPEAWGLEGFTALMGNHEIMFLNALDGYSMTDWVRNGGAVDQLDQLAPHAEWLRHLPYYVTVGDTLFAHAGVPYGEDPATYMTTYTRREEFVWQRGRFLDDGPGFDQWDTPLRRVVFGHTPRGPLPYEVPHGLCIDTLAVYTGVLTAYNATQDTIQQFYDENETTPAG